MENSATSSDRSFSTGQGFAQLVYREIGVEVKNIKDRIPDGFAGLKQSLESDWYIGHGKVDSVVPMSKREWLTKGTTIAVEFHIQE